jgi:hypothetical protein
MVSIGNRSKLSIQEICHSCGKCCTSFSWTDNADQALRFLWMEDKDIEVRDTPFKFPDGGKIKIITMKRGCKMLEVKDGKYLCKAYGKERPDFCIDYPDLIFRDINRNERGRIQKAIDFEKQDCPLFENLTVDDVISKLYGITKRQKNKQKK